MSSHIPTVGYLFVVVVMPVIQSSYSHTTVSYVYKRAKGSYKPQALDICITPGIGRSATARGLTSTLLQQQMWHTFDDMTREELCHCTSHENNITSGLHPLMHRLSLVCTAQPIKAASTTCWAHPPMKAMSNTGKLVFPTKCR